MEEKSVRTLLVLILLFSIAVLVLSLFIFARPRSEVRYVLVDEMPEELMETDKVEVVAPVEEEFVDEETFLRREAELFGLTIEQIYALKGEYDSTPLGFEEFHSFLVTLDVEAEGFGFTLAGVADRIIKEGYGLIYRDSLGRLALRYGG